MEDRAAARAEWRKHWPLALVSTVGLTFSPIPVFSLGLVMQPLEKEFGWSRADVNAGMIVVSVFAILFSSPVGALIDRFGARRVALPGMMLGIAAISAMSLANGSVWQWMALWMLYAIASLFIKTTVWCAAVSKAFFAGRGLALGVVLCGLGLAQTLTPVAAQQLIDGFGWRAAYRILGLGWGGLILVLLFLFFRDAESGAPPAEVRSDRDAPELLPGYSFGEAMRTRQILQVVGAGAVGGIVSVALSVHLVPILVEAGLSRAQGALLAGMFGLTMIAGKLLTGLVLDRIQGNMVPFLAFASPAASMALLLADTHNAAVTILAVTIQGFGAGAITQCATYLITRYGGLRSFGATLGVNSSVTGLAMGVGPWFAGKVFDATHSYHLVLAAGIPCAIVAGLLVMGLGPYPDFSVRKNVMPGMA